MIFNLSDKVKGVVEIIPLLTILTFVYGYIGFNTFTTIYQIPLVSTDISIIVSIGLFNLTYIAFLYFTASRKRSPLYIEALIIYIIFLFLLNRPTLIALILVCQIVLNGFILHKNPKKIDFKERKRKVIKFNKWTSLIDMTISAISVIVILFFNGDTFTVLLVIYILLMTFHRYKKYKQIPNLQIIVAIILFPVVTMYYFIDNSSSNVLGLNKQFAKIETTTDTISTVIIFSDNNYYYTHNDSLKTVTALNKNTVNKVITTSATRTDGNLIDLIRKLVKGSD